jgi:hypothetical protein
MTTTLYRSIGQAELDSKSDDIQNAQEWNTKDVASGFVGYVTRFAVSTEFLSRYDVKTIGATGNHDEYWIPAEELDAFNAALIGEIEVTGEFRP